MLLVMRIDKQLMNFEEYPNDVARGFNLWHMPLFYTFDGINNKQLTTPSMLVMTPEPDFSMPFNVNSVTHVLFGLLLVNTAYILSRTAAEEKGEDKSDENTK